MIIFIIRARCISMKVNLLRLIISSCKMKKKCKSQFAFPNPLIIQVSNIPNLTGSGPKKYPMVNFLNEWGQASNHIQLISIKINLFLKYKKQYRAACH
jgi:hypothetical protein